MWLIFNKLWLFYQVLFWETDSCVCDRTGLPTVRRSVGGGHHHHSSFEQGLKQLLQDHSISNVSHLKEGNHRRPFTYHIIYFFATMHVRRSNHAINTPCWLVSFRCADSVLCVFVSWPFTLSHIRAHLNHLNWLQMVTRHLFAEDE